MKFDTIQRSIRTGAFAAVLALIYPACDALQENDQDRTQFRALLALLIGNNAQAPQPTDLNLGYQTNLETLDLFGRFYHRKAAFPEIREFTHISVVKLDRALEIAEQNATDFNVFTLDGQQGLILYSHGLTGLRVRESSSYRGAKIIAVTPNGRIALIDAGGYLNVCSNFDGETVSESGGCVSTSHRPRTIAAHGRDAFVIVMLDRSVAIFDATTETLETQILPGTNNIRSAHSDGSTLTVIDRDGAALRSYRRTGGAGPWEEFANLEEIRIPLANGAQTAPIRVHGITRNGHANTYALAREQGMLLTLDSNLNVVAVLYFFPNWPRPMRRMVGAHDVQMAPASGIVHVYNRSIMESLSEGEFTQERFLRQTPTALLPVWEAVNNISIADFEANAGQDLFMHPTVQPVLQNAFTSIVLE